MANNFSTVRKVRPQAVVTCLFAAANTQIDLLLKNDFEFLKVRRLYNVKVR